MNENRISKETKVQIAEDLLNHKISLNSAARKLSVHVESVREWVHKYQTMGEEAFCKHKKSRYSSYLKEQAVLDYLSGRDSLRTICDKYKIQSTSRLRDWIIKYNSHSKFKPHIGGTGRIMSKGRKTTFDERIDIVKDYLESGVSYEEIAEKYEISYSQIYQWVHKYQEQGIDGLIDHRGKRKNPETMSETEKLRAELKMEKAKNKRLELENIVLKKLKEIERRRF